MMSLISSMIMFLNMVSSTSLMLAMRNTFFISIMMRIRIRSHTLIMLGSLIIMIRNLLTRMLSLILFSMIILIRILYMSRIHIRVLILM